MILIVNTYNGAEKISKNMVNGKSQVFHCWEWEVTDNR